MTSVVGVGFAEAWDRRFETRLEGLTVHVISRARLTLTGRAPYQDAPRNSVSTSRTVVQRMPG